MVSTIFREALKALRIAIRRSNARYGNQLYIVTHRGKFTRWTCRNLVAHLLTCEWKNVWSCTLHDLDCFPTGARRRRTSFGHETAHIGNDGWAGRWPRTHTEQKESIRTRSYQHDDPGNTASGSTGMAARAV